MSSKSPKILLYIILFNNTHIKNCTINTYDIWYSVVYTKKLLWIVSLHRELIIKKYIWKFSKLRTIDSIIISNNWVKKLGKSLYWNYVLLMFSFLFSMCRICFSNILQFKIWCNCCLLFLIPILIWCFSIQKIYKHHKFH